MKRLSKALAHFIVRRSWWLIIAVAILSAAAVPGVTMLETETGFDALVSSDAKISQDNSRYESQFGGAPITVLLTGQLDDIFSSGNLAVLAAFEEKLAQDERYQAISSPLTLLRTAQERANQARESFQEQLISAQEEAATQARESAEAMGLSDLQIEQAIEQAREEVFKEFQPLIEQMQLVGEAVMDNPRFVESVLYDAEGGVSQMMQSFVPDDEHAVILVIPQGNMSDEALLQAVQDIELFFSTNPLNQVDTTFISDARLVDSISADIGNNLAILLGLSIMVMIIILMVIFRVRWRLLSLLMVGISALWTFGLIGYLSIPVTMATMAVLPILIGLGIDFSIQFHNRYQEELTRNNNVAQAVITSVSSMFPVVGIALLATIVGFITLYVSEVPMIRDFGMVLAIGIVISYVVGLLMLHSIVYLADRKAPIKRLKEASSKASGRIEGVLSRVARLAVNHTLWVFLIALVFGIGGAVVDHWLPTNTDYEELIPQDTPELVEMRNLREITGIGGTLNFMVEADDVTRREILGWLYEYQNEALLSHPEIISVNSPATLVGEAAGGAVPDQAQIDAILGSMPRLYIEQVLSDDYATASVSFSLKYISLEETRDLLQVMQEEAGPPAGVMISPVGSLALGTNIMDSMVGDRLTMNLICLGAVLVILVLVYRRLGSTIFTIIPVGAVIAWSSLDMYLIGIPLNPLTAIMGVIIIGICTEFMVLLMGRYEEGKKLGLSPEDAMVTAISKIGRAIVTTALTTLGGFGVLIASNFVMIRDFGIATVVSVFLCLIITLTVMPGLIVWYDRWLRRRASR